MIMGLLISVALFAIALLVFLLRRRPAKVAGDFARRAILAQPSLTRSIEEITQAYVRIRYARNPQPNDITKLASLVKQFDR